MPNRPPEPYAGSDDHPKRALRAVPAGDGEAVTEAAMEASTPKYALSPIPKRYVVSGSMGFKSS